VCLSVCLSEVRVLWPNTPIWIALVLVPKDYHISQLLCIILDSGSGHEKGDLPVGLGRVLDSESFRLSSGRYLTAVLNSGLLFRHGGYRSTRWAPVSRRAVASEWVMLWQKTRLTVRWGTGRDVRGRRWRRRAAGSTARCPARPRSLRTRREAAPSLPSRRCNTVSARHTPHVQTALDAPAIIIHIQAQTFFRCLRYMDTIC